RASLISRSVASTPTWRTLTSTARPPGILQTWGCGWSDSLGTGISRRCTLLGLPGNTATAFIRGSPDQRKLFYRQRGGPPRQVDRCDRPARLLTRAELVDRRLSIGRSRAKDRRGKLGLIDRVRIVLGLETKRLLFLVDDAAFAFERAVEEIGCVELYRRLG